MIRQFEKERGFGFERVFSAPPETVFDCWTKPELLGWFFNPDNATDVATTVDLRVGGQWRQHMVISPSHHYMTGGVYRVIERPRRLVFTFGAIDGWPAIRLEALDDFPICEVLLEPHASGTLMRFRMIFPDAFSDAEIAAWTSTGAPQGWAMTIDRLAARYPARA